MRNHHEEVWPSEYAPSEILRLGPVNEGCNCHACTCLGCAVCSAPDDDEVLA